MSYIAPPVTLRRLCYYPLSCKVAIFSPLKVFTGRNFEARTLRFLHLEAFLFLYKTFLFIFLIRKFCASSCGLQNESIYFLFFIFSNFFRTELDIGKINCKVL